VTRFVARRARLMSGTNVSPDLLLTAALGVRLVWLG
jgi:hypothetical protein